jgi:hypothetical protein
MVSEIRLTRVIRKFGADPHINGFLVCGDAGEFSTCSFGERKTLVEHAVRDAQGKPVMVNVSSMSTAASLDLAQHANRHGARLAVCSAPCYGDYTDDELGGFFQLMSNYAGLPVFVVDPQNRLTENLWTKIGSLPGLKVPKPLAFGHYSTTRTDEFETEALKVSVVAAFASKDVGTLEGAFPELSGFGSQRIIKALLEHEELDCGPLRGPCKSLIPDQLKTLYEVLRRVKQVEPAAQSWPYGSSAA